MIKPFFDLQLQLIKACEYDFKKAYKLATINEVALGDGFGLENAGENAYCHVVVVHLVGCLTVNNFPLEEGEELKKNLAVQGRQLVHEI